MINQSELIENLEEIKHDGTWRYGRFILLEKASDGTYWVSGIERWLTLAQLDQLQPNSDY